MKIAGVFGEARKRLVYEKKTMLQYIRVVVALLLVIVPLSVRAGPIDLLAESDTDTVGGSELFLRAFNSLDDFYNDVKGPGDWSALDVGAGFSVAGMTWDGSDLYLLAESDTDTVGGSELFLRAFDSIDDFYNDVKGPGDWSALDVGAGFSVAGLASRSVAVPEPGTLALFGIGLAGMGLARRRKTI